MGHLQQVQVAPLPIGRLERIAGPEAARRLEKETGRMGELLAERVIWAVNSTAAGGGVAEMLPSILGYARGAGIDARWLVIRGGHDFFTVTKRLHHALHGSAGDGSALGEAERELYEETLRQNADELCSTVREGDFVVLHDPQTVGLAPRLVDAGAHVVWRCHIGADTGNEESRRGWKFLERYLAHVPAFVFSREQYVPDQIDRNRVTIVPPSIDPLSPKNQDLDARAVQAILVHVGIVEGPGPEKTRPTFRRFDGSRGRVERRCDVMRLGRAPHRDTPLVVQVSRWDALKDPVGVLHGFARLADGREASRAELVLAGPNVNAVADDPEGARVYDQVLDAWRALPHGLRDRVHLVSLPMTDVQENAAIVNALQRHAAVVVQKSLHEGFGLTVTEAMWKRRPVLASAVGGIRDQIEDGVQGLLLDDPTDEDAFAAALRRVLSDPELAKRLGEAAHRRVRERYLDVRAIVAYAELVEKLGGTPARRSLAEGSA